MELQQKIDYSGGSNPIYVGDAIRGTSPATARWLIKMLTYSGTNDVISAWANGTEAFDKIWTSRATYTYITS